MASMARKVYKVKVHFSTEGDVEGGCCDCVAGKGEACSHIAALLFAVDDFVAKGFKELPADKSVTDQLCGWNKPAKRTVEPKTIHNIRIVKQEHGKTPKERQTLCKTNFDPRQPTDRTRNEANVQKLIDTLSVANPTCGFIKYNTRKVVTEESPTGTETVQISSQHIDNPPSLENLRDACEQRKQTLNISREEAQSIERETVTQSESDLWYKVRKERLTASKFHAVAFMREKTNPKNLLKSLLYDKKKTTTAMSFGLKAEDDSAKRFCDYMHGQGVDVSLSQRGFIVDPSRPYLGASVDRVANISGEQHIVELKNPLSTWNYDMQSTARKLPCLKIDENNKIQLNRKHSYYTQIQGQMGILKIHKCFFVLCTKYDIFVELVEFDQSFWKNVQEKLDRFYNDIFLLELVYPSVKYGLPALDLGKLTY